MKIFKCACTVQGFHRQVWHPILPSTLYLISTTQQHSHMKCTFSCVWRCDHQCMRANTSLYNKFQIISPCHQHPYTTSVPKLPLWHMCCQGCHSLMPTGMLHTYISAYPLTQIQQLTLVLFQLKQHLLELQQTREALQEHIKASADQEAEQEAVQSE